MAHDHYYAPEVGYCRGCGMAYLMYGPAEDIGGYYCDKCNEEA